MLLILKLLRCWKLLNALYWRVNLIGIVYDVLGDLLVKLLVFRLLESPPLVAERCIIVVMAVGKPRLKNHRTVRPGFEFSSKLVFD